MTRRYRHLERETLSDAQRTVVLLHDVEGWNHRESAAVLGVAEGTSRAALFAARRRLRAWLGAAVDRPDAQGPVDAGRRIRQSITAWAHTHARRRRTMTATRPASRPTSDRRHAAEGAPPGPRAASHGAHTGAPAAPADWKAALPDLTLAALRVIAALVLMEHATQRAFGFPANPDRPFAGPPGAFTRPWFATVLELVGGTLLVLGLFTRPVAFVLSGLMAFAYFLVHAPQHFFPIVNRGEPAVLLCFVFLYLSAAGAGRVSLDAVSRRRGPR